MNAPIIPIPRSPVTVRVATAADLPFIDSLQKLHSKQVGWMPTKSLEQKIGLGHVLLAEDESKRPAGYCTGQDQYFKRDDVGIIYQLNVVPGRQRSFVGATLRLSGRRTGANCSAAGARRTSRRTTSGNRWGS